MCEASHRIREDTVDRDDVPAFERNNGDVLPHIDHRCPRDGQEAVRCVDRTSGQKGNRALERLVPQELWGDQGRGCYFRNRRHARDLFDDECSLQRPELSPGIEETVVIEQPLQRFVKKVAATQRRAGQLLVIL